MSSTLKAAQNYDREEDGPVLVSSSSESETENNSTQQAREEDEVHKEGLDGTQTTVDSNSSGNPPRSAGTEKNRPSPPVAPIAVGLPCDGERFIATSTAEDRAAKMSTGNNPAPAVATAATACVGEEDGNGIEMANVSSSSHGANEEETSVSQEEGNEGVEEVVSANQVHDEENPPTAESQSPLAPDEQDPEAAVSPHANEEPEAAPTAADRNLVTERASNRDLPVAEAVPQAPGEQPELTEAAVIAAVEIVRPGEEPKEGCRCFGRLLSPTQWAVGALLIVVLIVVGIVVGLISPRKDDCDGDSCKSEAPTMAPTVFVDTEAPTSAPVSCQFHEPFAADLHFLTSQALKEPCSPQSKANWWMVEDPYLDTYSKPRQLQRFALVTLYFSTGGENWKNKDSWLSYDEDECQWFNKGVNEVDRVCDDEFGMIHLNLSGNNLDGVLPVELFLFHALAVLDLSKNSLKGTAPTMFQGAKYLRRLDLSSNQLTGQFTAELGFVASNLSILQNDDNQFTGAVPGLLRLLPSLSRLNITGNLYTGALPESLIQLSSTLVAIEVAGNAITGAIPSELGAAKNLELFDVRGNSAMRGKIPAELATLSNLKLFDISGTNISGSLPGDLCLLEELTLVAECEGPFQCC